MSLDIPAEWEWSADVAENFGEHVREQLPWYDLATAAVAQIARHYIGRDGLVYDLGAATGNIGRALSQTVNARNAMFVAIDNAPDMVERYRGTGTAYCDEVDRFPYSPELDLAVGFLVLMFLRPERAEALIDDLMGRVTPGGALVFVERTTPPPGYLSVVTSRLTLNAKREAGVPAEEIIAKELSLTGVQRPMDPAVFTDRGGVEFFRFGDFAGYIIEGKRR